MSQSIDCVVAGHICLDVTPAFLGGGGTLSEVLRPGSLIQVGPATVSTGGPVSNTGFPLRRLGSDVRLMGKCGDDMFGRALIERIQAEAPGAEAGMQVVSGEKSSYTVVVSPPGIDRIFLHCPGSNDTFVATDIDTDVVRRARLFHFGYPPLMARMYADGGRELTRVFQDARAAGATTSLDLACPDPSGPAARADWAGILGRTLGCVDLFTPSAEELTLMLRRRTFDALVRQAGGAELLTALDGALLSELGAQCIDAGAAVVLIKCGYLGLYLRTAGRERLERVGRAKPGRVDQWAGRELFEPSYTVARIVSATGAGDCAIAGFLTAYLRGCGAADALRYACAVGAQNLEAPDSISGVRSWDETVEQVASRPAKNPVDIELSGWRWDESARHYVGPDAAAERS